MRNLIIYNNIMTDLPVEKIGIIGVWSVVLIAVVLVFCYKIFKINDKK